MRFLVVLLALVALPVLVLVHRNIYFVSMSPELNGKVRQALNKEGLGGVTVNMSYLDVILSGRVADLPSREKATEIVNQLPGVRSQSHDNRIKVNAKLQGRWEGARYRLSGWLHDEQAIKAVQSWLVSSRPSLEVDVSEVTYSPYVITEPIPTQGNIPEFFSAVWTAIELPSNLYLHKNGTEIEASGRVHSEAFRLALLDAIKEANPALTLKADSLKSGDYVRSKGFVHEDELLIFVRSFYASPEPGNFETDGKTIRVTGNVTEATRLEWEAQLIRLNPDAKLDLALTQFPSPYHLPGYKPSSNLEPDMVTALTEVLAEYAVTFDMGEAKIPERELPKVNAACIALVTAGPEAKIVIGCHPDITGDEKTNAIMARRRAEAISDRMQRRDVHGSRIEVVDFTPARGGAGADLGRRAEILLK